MSESVKPRFAVDLNEIERQIAQAQGAPSQSAPATRNDPLAELARIVGQDDPFQSLLANDRPARPRNQANAGLDDLFATRDEPAPANVAHFPVRHAAPAAPAYQHDDYADSVAPAAQPAYSYQEPAHAQGHDAYANESYDQGYYDDQDGQSYDPADRMDYAPQEKPRSRKGLILVGALVGAVVVGGGGAYLLGGNSTSFSGGQPPLIAASNEPIKVQPQNPGGVEIPNQNKQIYERANQTDTKVVSHEEQPVDVKQAVRMNSGESTGATNAGQPARQPAHGMNLGEPRKVRTVTIRPDGSTVQPETVHARAPAAALPTMSLPAAAQPNAPAPRATPQAVASTPAAAPATPAPKPAPAATPAPAASTPAPAASTPASGASPQRVASAQPVAVAPAAASEATGGFAVQLGVSGSEGDAQAAFDRFQKKFSDLEGKPALIRKAEVNGNTVYRVRVGPMSRDEASSLCSKLQGQGGQCFVAKN